MDGTFFLLSMYYETTFLLLNICSLSVGITCFSRILIHCLFLIKIFVSVPYTYFVIISSRHNVLYLLISVMKSLCVCVYKVWKNFHVYILYILPLCVYIHTHAHMYVYAIYKINIHIYFSIPIVYYYIIDNLKLLKK